MNCQKHLFQLDSDIHYLNNATKGPLLRSAEEAAIHALQRGRNPAAVTVDHFFDLAAEVKSLYAQLVNCDADQVALIPSVSYGIASILKNVKPKPNGNVITIQDEFPSDVFAAQAWCERHDNELIFVSPSTKDRTEIGSNWNNNILNQINEQTTFVIISSLHWANGIDFKLKEIGEKCHEYKAKLIVDGTQSVGTQPINLKETKISALVSASYKWLLGPYSVGMMYLDESFYDGTPLEETWMNRTNAKNFSGLTEYDPKYTNNAGRYNMGEFSNFILLPIAKAGLEQILKWTPEAIQEYDKKLTAPLFDYLGIKDNSSYSNHLFSLPVPASVNKEKLKESFTRNNIVVSHRGESIRVSVNVFNDENNINTLIKAIEQSK